MSSSHHGTDRHRARRAGRLRGPAGRRLVVLLAATAFLAGLADETGAQEVPAVYGFAAGTAAGAYVTTGIFVARARTGSYIYSLEDALRPRWELLPAVAMPIGGLLLGAEDGQRLASAVAWGGAGFAVGAVVGLGIGELLGETSQGRWAGFIIGSATGLLAGTIYGAATYEPNEAPGTRQGAAMTRRTPAAITIRFPL